MDTGVDFLRLAAERYSVREYDGRPVEKDVLDQIVQAGYLAPTACNRQPWRALVLRGEDAMAKLRKCTPSHFDAPNAIIVYADRSECWKRSFDGKSSGDIDAAIVTTHMMLAAASLGVGSTWVMYFIPEAVREEFCAPDDLEPIALLTLGYPSDRARPSASHGEFRPINELVFHDHF